MKFISLQFVVAITYVNLKSLHVCSKLPLCYTYTFKAFKKGSDHPLIHHFDAFHAFVVNNQIL